MWCGIIIVMAVLVLSGLGAVECSRDYITWDDLKVDRDKPGRREVKESGDSLRLSGSASVIVVDQNGAGDSLTVQGAVDLVPVNNTDRVKILILPGIYRFHLLPTSETVISWNNKAGDIGSNGLEMGTAGSASVTVESDYFCATGITFQVINWPELIGYFDREYVDKVEYLVQNTVVAVPGGYNMQAVALRVAGDKAVFYKVHILGTQDTLLDETGTHYYYHCFIQGRVDFICGNAKSLFKVLLRNHTAKGSGAIAAHHRNSADEDTGFSFVNCVIDGKGKILLGRAWGNYSRTIYSHCYMNDIIAPSGWSDWNAPDRQRTADFGEYRCIGRGSDRSRRVPWSKSLSRDTAKPFLSTNDDNLYTEREYCIRPRF